MSTTQERVANSSTSSPGSKNEVLHEPSMRPPGPELDLGSPGFHANPFHEQAFLHTSAPMHSIVLPDGNRAWLATRFEDAAQVLKDPRLSMVPPPGYSVPPSIVMSLMGRSMICADPPDHTRLRGLLSKAFTPRFIEGLRPRVQEIADTLIDALEPRGQMEFISDFAFPLPITVIAEMLGIPARDHARLRDWSAMLFDSMSMRVDAESLAAADEFADYVDELIEAKRREPGADLISHLVQAEEAGSKLDHEELKSTIVLLIFAGHETTVNLLGNGMLTLFTHPDQLDKLKRDPSLIPAAVEELLRFCGPALSLVVRYATEDLEIGGTLISKGERIVPGVAAANQDGARLPRAEAFDLTRPSSKHLAFGLGIHFCIGAPLARMEAQVALATLLRRLPGLRLDVPVDQLRWRGNMLLYGLHALPVAF